MRHSLMLYANILLERDQIEGVVSQQLAEKDLSCLEIRLVLVVKNAEKEYMEDSDLVSLMKKRLERNILFFDLHMTGQYSGKEYCLVFL